MSEGKETLVKDSIDRGTVDAARALESDKYAEGFVTDIEMELAPKGLSEDTVRYISAKKEEPEWMLQWRLEAFQRWKEMTEPTWAMINYPKIDYQDAHYYAEPKGAAKYKTIDDVPKEILETYAKLGIPLKEQEVLLGVEGAMETAAAARETPRVAVDAVFDTAPMRDENQLHAAVVELVALADAEIKYSTVQNWWPGDAEGKGGIYNFVTKRGDCRGARSRISWTQVETGSAITWKYPSCILRGDDSSGEFYSIAVTNGRQ